MAKRTRNKRGQFVKGGGRRKTVALARRAPTAVARRRRAPAVRTVTVRRRSSGGGAMAPIGKYLGGPQLDTTLASLGLGVVVNKRRATVETVINYAPEFVRGVGAYGVIALGAGLLSHFGVARKYTSPLARAATYIAVNKLGTRGGFYEAGEYNASLSGDDGGDDIAGDDDLDVGAFGDEMDDGLSGDDPDGFDDAPGA